MTKNEIDAFIKARVGDSPDDEGLNKFEKRWKWLSVSGKVFDEAGESPDKWQDYIVQYVGVIIHRFRRSVSKADALRLVRVKNPLFLTVFVDRPSPLVLQVRRVRIFHKEERAFLDVRYVSKDETDAAGVRHLSFAKTETDLRNVDLANSKAFETTCKRLRKGGELRSLIEMRLGGGRAKDTGHINDSNKWEAHDLAIEQGKAILREGGDPTAHNVATRCNGKYGISGRSKDAARQTMNRLAKKCYPPRGTWKNDLLPLIKTNRSS